MTTLDVGVIGTRGWNDPYSGIERISAELYSRLAARGHRVTVYSRRVVAPTTHDGVVAKTAPILRHPSLETVSHVLSSTAQALIARRHDVIHFHALAPGLVARVCVAARTPTVLTVHGLDWKRARWAGVGSRVLQLAERAAARHVNEMIVVSRELEEYYWHRYRRRVAHIPNAVDVVAQNQRGDATILDSGALRPQRYLLFVGRLVPEKRVEDLLAAFGAIDYDGQLAIAGAGTPRYVRALRELAGRDRRVLMLGWQDPPRVRELLRHALAFVSASELEGLPLALLECVAQGVPAITSDIRPHREVLEPLGAGELFFAATDVGRLARRLREVTAEPAPHRERALRARSKLEQHFSIDSVVERTEEVLVKAAVHGRGAR